MALRALLFCSSSPCLRLVANETLCCWMIIISACDAEHFLFPFSSLIINK